MDGQHLSNNERRLLRNMKDDHSKSWDVASILEQCQWNDQAIAVGAAQGLVEKGLLEEDEQHSTMVRRLQNGDNALQQGLLEQRIFSWIESSEEPSMAAFQQQFDRSEAGPGIGLMKKLGMQTESGMLSFVDQQDVLNLISRRMEFLAQLPQNVDQCDQELLEHFKQRKQFIELVESVKRSWRVSEKGLSIAPESLEEVDFINEITPELLQSEQWQNSQFRPFDVTLEAATPRTGRAHPMQALIERIRSIFLEMGFSELVDDYVQSAGWNMDALFIPQDHPAREMQDTFYLSQPTTINIDESTLANWKSIHQSGGETGSRGWGGHFSEEVSKRPLLRTHTTVNTVQYLARHPHEPCRVFSVDRVFRNESIDRTHLPEFHQIEGIILEPDANLQMLVTTLKTFYAKMGLPEVRVRPAYFPYTEPSLEVEVKWKGKWLELGGAGIFRPEVTEPLGITWPVSAWGMGLERLAMLVLNLDDIRQLYISDIDWLQNQQIL
ncbi:MAG: phenylalanine--tRNA ligase subunit alpha [Candidatus Poseidoniales archaeon]